MFFHHRAGTTEKSLAKNLRKALLVRSTGLEPVPIAGHAPQTCAYAYSATTASTKVIILCGKGFVKNCFIQNLKLYDVSFDIRKCEQHE